MKAGANIEPIEETKHAMRVTSGFAALFSILMLLTLPNRADSQVTLSELHLGFAECAPAVFMPLRSGTTVRIDITYAETGALSSYREEVTRDGSQPTTALLVSVDLSKWNGRCSSLAYTVAANGRSLSSPAHDGFDDGKLPRTVAFSPVEHVGAVIGGGALESDFRTETAYDDRGRRYISRQALGSGGTFEITYADYRWTSLGKVAGYTARISAPAK